MEQTRNLVLKCLDEYEDDDRLIKELNQIIEKEGKKAYPVIFHVLTNRFFSHLVESNEGKWLII